MIPLHPDRVTIVSILAHAEARALQAFIDGNIDRFQFQSSPTPKRGRYVVDGQRCRLEAVVSILAHAEARALHTSERDAGEPVSFQSSPTPKRGRYV